MSIWDTILVTHSNFTFQFVSRFISARAQLHSSPAQSFCSGWGGRPGPDPGLQILCTLLEEVLLAVNAATNARGSPGRRVELTDLAVRMREAEIACRDWLGTGID